MTKRNKIIYWVSTIWLAVAMLASGVPQILLTKSFADIMVPLGYPQYFMCILGAWKIPGVIAILIPKFALLRKWAYAASFLQCRVLCSHILHPEARLMKSYLHLF